ncbi:MAG: hypothetical protein QOE45_3232 [Frankiaceae bacterium]|jgi:hypothetical protein|nr:hypothetical protein [Frankiaceae bacterium]
MTEQHVPMEELAAYAAGDLDATAAVAVEAHVLLCAQCAADVAGLTATAAALAEVPRVAMPADAAAALDAALLAAATPGGRRAGDVVVPIRRRPSFAGIAAVAAGVALLTAVSVPLLRNTTKSPGSAATTALSPATSLDSGAATKRLASGLDYTRANLAGTLVAAVNGARDSAVAGAAAPDVAATPRASAEKGATQGEVLNSRLAVATDDSRYAACVAELAKGQPSTAAVPLVVDFATFAGKPAIIVAFPYVSSRGTPSNKIDVFVAGASCGAVAGGDVLDFQRIDRPAGL